MNPKGRPRKGTAVNPTANLTIRVSLEVKEWLLDRGASAMVEQMSRQAMYPVHQSSQPLTVKVVSDALVSSQPREFTYSDQDVDDVNEMVAEVRAKTPLQQLADVARAQQLDDGIIIV